MKVNEAQTRMNNLEQHDQEWTAGEFIEWLLDLEGGREQIDQALLTETHRAFILAEGHYQRVTNRAAILNPQMIAQVGFIQGATFAAAALGRNPFPHGGK